MKSYESLAFRLVAIGAKFFDSYNGEHFRKVSATHAEFVTGGVRIKGTREEFKPSDEIRAQVPCGYQIADASGANIQGDDNDPSGYDSSEILTREKAQSVIDRYPAQHLQLFAIYPGDIEEPIFLD